MPLSLKKGACNVLQRYFLSKPFDLEGNATISGEDGKHIVRVMRMAIGDHVIAVSDGDAYVSTIMEQLVDGVVVHREGDSLPSSEMPVRVTIACGLPKGDKLDLITQKGTELGMRGLIPFEAERSIVKWDDKKGGKKVERLRKIAKEAAEQCHRSAVPEVETPYSFKQLLTAAKHYDVLLVADEEDAKSGNPHKIAERLKNVYHKQTVLAVFGPEGGLSRNEVIGITLGRFSSNGIRPAHIKNRNGSIVFIVRYVLRI